MIGDMAMVIVPGWQQVGIHNSLLGQLYQANGGRYGYTNDPDTGNHEQSEKT